MSDLKFGVERRAFSYRIEVHAWKKFDQQRTAIMRPVIMAEFDEGEILSGEEPAMRLTPEEATNLMDELYRVGIRPTEVGSAGERAAILEHLKDMRAIAFGYVQADRENVK